MGTLLQKLGIGVQHRIVSIVGSGGKTTLMYALARECAQKGETVGITTTTHIKRPNEPDFLLADSKSIPLAAGRVTAVGKGAEHGKMAMPSHDKLDELCRRASRVFIEADGARMLPIKYPNATEPVILPCTDLVIAVTGLSALGKPLKDVCCRVQLAQEMLGVHPDEPVTPNIIAALLIKGYSRWNPVIVLNQADDDRVRVQAEQAAALLRSGGFQKIVITSLKQEVL